MRIVTLVTQNNRSNVQQAGGADDYDRTTKYRFEAMEASIEYDIIIMQ